MDFYLSVDFLAQIKKHNMITNRIKKEIIEKAKTSFPEECCGFVIKKHNNLSVIHCKNIAKDKLNHFMISARDFIKVKNYADQILFLYHNHVNQREFSILDKQTADVLRINLLLYINEINLFKIYYHDQFKKLNYLFKEYDNNENNCFHLVKNYFKNELSINLNIDENLFKNKKVQAAEAEEIINQYYIKNNLIKIVKNEDLKLNDILVLKNKFSTHLAIYIGSDKILHQPYNRISIIEDLDKNYRNQIQYILRNKLYDKS